MRLFGWEMGRGFGWLGVAWWIAAIFRGCSGWWLRWGAGWVAVFSWSLVGWIAGGGLAVDCGFGLIWWRRVFGAEDGLVSSKRHGWVAACGFFRGKGMAWAGICRGLGCDVCSEGHGDGVVWALNATVMVRSVLTVCACVAAVDVWFDGLCRRGVVV